MYFDLLRITFTSLHPSSGAKPLGSDRTPEKPPLLVLSKAETMKFDGASSRVGKVVDWVLQTSVGRPQDDELD